MTAREVVQRPLRSYTREEAARQSRLSRPRGPLPLGDGWLLHDAVPVPADAGDGWRRVDLTVSGVRAALFCPAGLLQAVLRSVPGELDAAPDLLPLLLELALEERLNRLETATGTESVVRGSDAAAPLPPDARALALEAFGRRWARAMEAPAATLDGLLGRWPTAPWPVDQVRLPATLRLGTTGLTLGVLRSLRVGDVALMERRAGPARGMLVVAGHLLAPAGWGRGWTLHHAPTARVADREDWLGTGEESGRTPPNGDAANEDEIPVTLCFDLGRLELTLAELRQLGPGAVLELPGTADAPVRLPVGGRCIGTGELVEVEGRAGVRVLRILGHG